MYQAPMTYDEVGKVIGAYIKAYKAFEAICHGPNEDADAFRKAMTASVDSYDVAHATIMREGRMSASQAHDVMAWAVRI